MRILFLFSQEQKFKLNTVKERQIFFSNFIIANAKNKQTLEGERIVLYVLILDVFHTEKSALSKVASVLYFVYSTQK